jgi:hypothetical protein
MLNLIKNLAASNANNDRGAVIARSGITESLLDKKLATEIDQKQYKYGGFICIQITAKGILYLSNYAPN